VVENHHFYTIRRPHNKGSHRNIASPSVIEKLEWWGYLMVEKFWEYVQWCRQNTSMWQTDGQTDTLRQHSPRYTYSNDSS